MSNVSRSPERPKYRLKQANKDRRAELIEATIATIASEGLSSTTVAKVAKQANLSPGIVSFYFAGKEQLLLETLTFLRDEFDRALRQALDTATQDAAQRMRNVIQMHFSPSICEPQRIAVWTAFWGESRARADYQTICKDSDQTYLQQLLALGKELAELESQTIATEAVTRALEGLLETLHQDMLVAGDQFDRQHAERLCLDYLATVFPDSFAPIPETPTDPTQATHSSTSLAPWTYFSEPLLNLEKTELFYKNWLFVGHINDMPHPGDYLTYDASGERALIIRGDDGHIRAFHNVCRHRGSRLMVNDRGHCPRSIVCPFHGWTYDLRGSLKGIPQARTFSNLQTDQLDLVNLELELCFGLIFIRFGGDGPNISNILAPIADDLGSYQIAKMQGFTRPTEEIFDVNWKSLHDIDNEGYHVSIGHPSLNALLENYTDNYLSDHLATSTAIVSPQTTRHWSVARYQKLCPEFQHLPQAKQKQWFYVGLFPNLVLSFSPELLECYQTMPVNVGQTRMLSATYALPDERREVRVVRYLNQRINQRTSDEDAQLVRESYKAMRSSQFPRGRLSSLEYGVGAFHEMIRRAIPQAGLESAPRSFGA